MTLVKCKTISLLLHCLTFDIQ